MRVRDRDVYIVLADEVTYLLDDYGDLFANFPMRHWVNTLTGDIVGAYRSRKLSRLLDKAIASGNMVSAYDAS